LQLRGSLEPKNRGLDMNKITPPLWFDREAEEAIKFQISNFPNSRITNETTIGGVPAPGEIATLYPSRKFDIAARKRAYEGK
jgi:predicted 3-demethylubiquinone-9 3-methyltransferase (glyoxalase superfamily)